MASTEAAKSAIRRRLFDAALARGETPPDSLARWFVLCPECGGSGRFTEFWIEENGAECHGHGLCPDCDGTGYRERESTYSQD